MSRKTERPRRTHLYFIVRGREIELSFSREISILECLAKSMFCSQGPLERLLCNYLQAFTFSPKYPKQCELVNHTFVQSFENWCSLKKRFMTAQ